MELDPAPLSSPSLALELADSGGRPVPLPPPPVPGGSREPPVSLDPGVEYRVEFPVFVPGWFEPGEYRVRLRYVAGGEPPVYSDWAEFSLGS